MSLAFNWLACETAVLLVAESYGWMGGCMEGGKGGGGGGYNAWYSAPDPAPAS